MTAFQRAIAVDGICGHIIHAKYRLVAADEALEILEDWIDEAWIDEAYTDEDDNDLRYVRMLGLRSAILLGTSVMWTSPEIP